jgi:hypothetical protein
MSKKFNLLFEKNINSELTIPIIYCKQNILLNGDYLLENYFQLYLRYVEKEQIDNAMKVKKIMFNLSKIIDEIFEDTS